MASPANTGGMELPAAPVRFDRRAIPDAAVEGIWRARDGWAIRRIDWFAKGSGSARGSVLFMPGRGDIYEKYLEVLDHWHGRGWRVTAMDWRGQGGSGRLSPDGSTGHIDDFMTWVVDLADFWAEWVRETPAPHVLMGHSMGGHLVVRALVEQAVRPDAAVVTAPMLGLIVRGVPGPLRLMVARGICALGDPRRAAWEGGESPLHHPDDRMGMLTHDAVRYADEHWWRAARPGLQSGAASWGWIVAALRSIRRIEGAGMLESVRVPVLLATTDADSLVDPVAIRRAAGRLPLGELFALGDEARHEVLREVDAVRLRVLAAIDGFLDRVAVRAG